MKAYGLCPRKRAVVTTDNRAAVARAPAAEPLPMESLRLITAGRIIRSAWLFVASTLSKYRQCQRQPCLLLRVVAIVGVSSSGTPTSTSASRSEERRVG